MAGQTLSEIRRLLAEAGIAPRKRHGQNFLIDLNLMRRIVAAANLRPDDVVLEVGCGTGSLTEMVLEPGCDVVGVEIDEGLQGILFERLGSNPKFHLVRDDILSSKNEVNPAVADQVRAVAGSGRPVKLVANLPYDVATPLLIELLCGPLEFARMVVTVQQEVGMRLAAETNTQDYGPVSVVAQRLAEVRLGQRLPPQVFWPQPKVDSVTAELTPRNEVSLEERRSFRDFVRAGFAHRRKMLRAFAKSWEGVDGASLLRAAGVSEQRRPQELTMHEWVRLHQTQTSARGGESAEQ
jgi:16S rRNA (adenine1518-N6/adenine1519-N6)-dimethyltransferase